MKQSIFKFEEKEIRTFTKVNGDVWFVAKDVCDALGLTNNRMSLNVLEKSEKGVSSIYTPGGAQEVLTISESGMYTLVLRCRDAVKVGTMPHSFKNWVTQTVLPSLRKTGSYTGSHKILDDLAASNTIAKDLLQKVVEQQPAVAYTQLVKQTENNVSVHNAALQFKIGRNRLFSYLRNEGYLRDNNMPYQRFVDSGLFVVNQDIDEENSSTYTTTFITPKGLTHLGPIIQEEFKTKVA